MPNPPGHFLYKIGDKVTVTSPSTGVVVLGRVIARTVERALGKTYLIRNQRGQSLGYIPEDRLSPR